MKTVIAVLLVVGLTGCASTNAGYVDHRSRSSMRTETDANYVAAVESQARQHGVGVYWVHKPTVQIALDKH